MPNGAPISTWIVRFSTWKRLSRRCSEFWKWCKNGSEASTWQEAPVRAKQKLPSSGLAKTAAHYLLLVLISFGCTTPRLRNGSSSVPADMESAEIVGKLDQSSLE